MKKYLAFLFIPFLFGCDIQEPDVYDFDNFKMIKMNGREIDGSFDVSVKNDNSFGFKLKKANLLVMVEEFEAGTIKLDHKVKIKRKSDKSYTIPIHLSLKEGALLKLAKLAVKKEFNVNFKGTVKGSVLGIGKTINIDENKTLKGSDLTIPQQ